MQVVGAEPRLKTRIVDGFSLEVAFAVEQRQKVAGRKAKARRTPLGDIAEVLTFDRW
jgi:hypothetical protein